MTLRLTQTELQPFHGGRILLWGGLSAGIVGGLFTAVGFFLEPRQAFFSYLIAYNYIVSIVLGTIILLCACHAMNATWPVAIRRLLEATIASTPLMALLFVPLLFGLGELYPFVHPERVADASTRHLLEHKRHWLNQPFFIGRTIGYLAVWTALGLSLRSLSFKLDEPGNVAVKGTLKVLSCAVLPLLGLTLTFASFDWVMALSPDWYSTMFGIYYFAGGFIAALALLPLLLAAAQSGGWLLGVGRSHSYALGRLLLSFVIFWAYIAFFQFFLIWIANKPIEARWYVDRIQGSYRGVSYFLLFGHFALPFFVLLSYWIKQRIVRLLPVATWLLLAHYFDVHWLIAPARHAPHPFSWLDLTSVVSLVGFTVAFAVWRQRGHRLASVADPAYERALEYESI
jgi:hypothetical protein